MKAFIEINPKSHKGGQIFINEVSNESDAHGWFAINMEYMEKQAKRRSIEDVRMYIKDQYKVVFEKVLQ